MTIYVTETNHETVVFSADLTNAAAPVWVRDGGRWEPTPYQTASAGHDVHMLAEFVLHYLEIDGRILDVDRLDPARAETLDELAETLERMIELDVARDDDIDWHNLPTWGDAPDDDPDYWACDISSWDETRLLVISGGILSLDEREAA